MNIPPSTPVAIPMTVELMVAAERAVPILDTRMQRTGWHILRDAAQGVAIIVSEDHRALRFQGHGNRGGVFWDITQVAAGCYAVDHPALSLQAA